MLLPSGIQVVNTYYGKSGDSLLIEFSYSREDKELDGRYYPKEIFTRKDKIISDGKLGIYFEDKVIENSKSPEDTEKKTQLVLQNGDKKLVLLDSNFKSFADVGNVKLNFGFNLNIGKLPYKTIYLHIQVETNLTMRMDFKFANPQFNIEKLRDLEPDLYYPVIVEGSRVGTTPNSYEEALYGNGGRPSLEFTTRLVRLPYSAYSSSLSEVDNKTKLTTPDLLNNARNIVRPIVPDINFESRIDLEINTKDIYKTYVRNMFGGNEQAVEKPNTMVTISKEKENSKPDVEVLTAKSVGRISVIACNSLNKKNKKKA